MQDIDRIAAYPVEDTKWVSDDRGNPDLRALRDPGGCFRRKTNALDHGNETPLDRLSYRRTGVDGIVGCNVFKIG